MARRKKSPATATIEAILWHDADGKFRQVLDTSPVLNHTVGFVVYEDSQQVVLAHEVSAVEQWLEQRIGEWQRSGIDLARVVFDPGIGFGKTPRTVTVSVFVATVGDT